MYKNKLPKSGEIVFVQLNSNSDNYVTLVDYELSGLVLCTEITKYKADLKGIVRSNEIFSVMVMDIDEEGKNIDLSYAKIKFDKREHLKNCYQSQNRFFKFIESSKTNRTNEFVEKHLIPENYNEAMLNNKNVPKEKFDKFLLDPESFTDDKILIDYVKSKVIMKPYECVLEFKLCVFDNTSLSKLKEILEKIKNIDTEIEINCRSSPFYQIKVKNINLEFIKDKYETVKENIILITNKYNSVLEFEKEYKIIKNFEIDIL